MKTVFFSHCSAVFEGGGVRGAAYAGAYEAAVNAGISFHRVAGTSAGSVAAALVAAGGSPDEVKTKLIELDMAGFQRPVDKRSIPFLKHGVVASVLSNLPSKKAQMLGQFMRYSGLFSSHGVREWVENCLRDILGGCLELEPSQPVRFCDLPTPLYIVATDILQQRPKIWSKESTPQESVAFAVQASCAIPFYFQGVKDAQSVFVDGGAVSNLPSYVFPPRTNHPGRLAERTLAFRLKADAPSAKSDFNDSIDYGIGIINAVISSATEIQQTLQGGIFYIDIPTGDIKATDFDKIDDRGKSILISNGAKAVEDFVKKEREITGGHRHATKYTGFDERLFVYVYAISEAKETIWFSDASTYWLYYIYPIIASAVTRGVSVKAIVLDPPLKNAPEEKRRREKLISLGCDVVPVGTLEFTGIIIDFPGTQSIAIISSEDGVVGQDFGYADEEVRLYDANDDLPVIRNLGNALAMQVRQGAISTVKRSDINITSLDPLQLYDGLRRVPQYSDARFSIEDIPLGEKLRASQTRVKEFKLLQVEKLIRDLDACGFDLFAPCQYILMDGTTSIITPPVLEMTAQGPVIIEGHTRAFYLARTRRERFRAVVVHNVQEPLPVVPRPISEMRIADNTMTASALLPNYDKRLFRHIEAALHP